MLFTECTKGNVKIKNLVIIQAMHQDLSGWLLVKTNYGIKRATSITMTTGELPVPAIGATTYSLDIVK